MNRILGLILIFVALEAPAAQRLQVFFGAGQEVLCQQEAKSEFWSCKNQHLLFVGDTSVGQVPTLHHLQYLDVKVPARIFDLDANKEIYFNPQNFQYQHPEKSAAESYYRKHNLMMSFEPRLRTCILQDCQKLKEVLNPLLYRQDAEVTSAFAAEMDANLLEQIKLLPSAPMKPLKSVAQMMAAFAAVTADASLRYDYLRDGCFARAELVAAQLAAQGFEVFKIWVHGFSLWGGRFEKPADFFGWRYHVAPAVRVEEKLWVFDPGFFTSSVKPHQWVNEVFGPNQKVIVSSHFFEEELAATATVAVSLSPWQMYPGYVSVVSATAVSDQEISANLEEARSILDELGLK